MGCDMQFSRKKPMFRAIPLPLGFYTLKSEASVSTEGEVPLQNYTRTLLHLRTQSLIPLNTPFVTQEVPYLMALT
jgi:hypothetical protein